MTRHRPPIEVRPVRVSYRKFPSRYGWNRPGGAHGWLGWTLGIRLAVPIALVYVIVRHWPS